MLVLHIGKGVAVVGERNRLAVHQHRLDLIAIGGGEGKGLALALFHLDLVCGRDRTVAACGGSDDDIIGDIGRVGQVGGDVHFKRQIRNLIVEIGIILRLAVHRCITGTIGAFQGICGHRRRIAVEIDVRQICLLIKSIVPNIRYGGGDHNTFDQGVGANAVPERSSIDLRYGCPINLCGDHNIGILAGVAGNGTVLKVKCTRGGRRRRCLCRVEVGGSACTDGESGRQRQDQAQRQDQRQALLCKLHNLLFPSFSIKFFWGASARLPVFPASCARGKSLFLCKTTSFPFSKDRDLHTSAARTPTAGRGRGSGWRRGG